MKAKGFDLKNLSTNHNDSSRLFLLDLNGKELIDSDGKKIYLDIVGSDSKIYRDALREKQRMMIDENSSNKAMDTADVIEELQSYAVAKSVKGWSGFLFDGKPLDHSFKNTEKIFEACPEAKEQAVRFQKNRANFIKTS